MRLQQLIVTLALVLLGASGLRAQEMRTQTLTIGFFKVTAEIAQTPQERARGLMGRQSLAPNHGMLFVFDTPGRQCFWMRNTPLPLTVAFIDARGTITSFADMTPFSEQAHCSTVPVRFALEMEQGWFKKRGVLVGDTVTMPNVR
jgi:uncharacterized protein